MKKSSMKLASMRFNYESTLMHTNHKVAGTNMRKRSRLRS